MNKKIIALGASAGGLRVLEEFFKEVPDFTTNSFVIVQHLSPNFKSLMPKLLVAYTKLPIQEIEDGMEIRPGNIYIIPAGKLITIANRLFKIRPRKGLDLPINVFMKSLADDAGSNVIGVVLSGTGSDGTDGCEAIREAGGLVIAQEPDSAEFPSMPASVIRNKFSHLTLHPDKMWSAIKKYDGIPGDNVSGRERPESSIIEGLEEADPDFVDIFSFLNSRYGIDFSDYKIASVLRRIERRLEMLKIKELPEYLENLQRDESEANSLYRDLLIGVTSFFRDSEVYDALTDEYLRPLLSEKKGRKEFRIWVAGCASGEEAYSLAILTDEIARESGYGGSITIFATDLHDDSVRMAAAGIYEEKSLANLSEERLEKYFIRKENGDFQIRSRLRKKVIFAKHNLLADPPFTRIDLVTCRNLLIYLKPDAQDAVLHSLHYALMGGGALLLGSSEGLGNFEFGFETISKDQKLYRKIISRKSENLSRQLFLRHKSRHSKSERRLEDRVSQLDSAPTIPVDRNLIKVYDLMLKQYAPTGVLITPEREVQHFFGDVGRFLKPIEGRVENDFLNRLEGDLRLAVSSTIQRVLSTSQSVPAEGVSCTTRHGEDIIDVTVRRFSEEGKDLGLILISFDSQTDANPTEEPIEKFTIEEGAQRRIHILEDELSSMKLNLKDSVEELQATNEALQISNEELQSTNEEFHSMNEDLYSINAELEQTNDQLGVLNADHENLLASTEDGVLYIDLGKRIKKFNPAIAFAFNLLPQDIGRPIEHIAYNLERASQMLEDVDSVIQYGTRKEREMRSKEGVNYLRRVTPLFDSDERVDGVILTFTDISASTKMKNRLNLAMTMAHMAWWEWELESNKISIHAEGECILGYECEGESYSSEFWFDRVHPDDVEEVRRTLDDCLSGKTDSWVCEHRYARSAATLTEWDWVYETGKISRWSNTGKPLEMEGTTMNINDRKLMEIENRNAKERAEEGLRIKDEFLSVMSHEIRTPLNGICGMAELLQNEVNTPHITEQVAVIKTCSDSLLSLINGILDYSKAESSRLQLIAEDCDIPKVLVDVEKVLSASCREQGVTIEKSYRASSDFYRIDGERLLQILVNIAGNAVKFSEHGDKVIISVSETSEDRRKLTFSVKDEGIGIDTKFVKDIFEPFSQQDSSSTRKHGGVGLGLSISKKLIALMGGEIEVSSVKDEGTEVIFTVEAEIVSNGRKETEESETVEREKKEDRPLYKETVREEKILVVDDDSSNLIVLEKMINRCGFAVHAVASVKEAVEALQESGPFFAAILDLHMPEGSGYELYQSIRNGDAGAKNREISIFACTADASERAREHVNELGFDGILIKPIYLGVLRKMLKAIGVS